VGHTCKEMKVMSLATQIKLKIFRVKQDNVFDRTFIKV
jgi:hypothetical protein